MDEVPTTDDSLNNRRVLAVDDSPANLELIEEVLSEEGLSVQGVLSGEEAIRAARANPPDLILLDLMMPGMSGLQVCQVLKTDDDLSQIPIVFLTAATDVERQVEAFRVGAVDYVTKPVKPEILVARVTTHLRLNLLRQESERAAQLTGALAAVVAVSHEINNPLQGLLGAAELLRMKTDAADEAIRTNVDTVVELSLRIRDVVKRMANLAKPAFEEYRPGVPMVDLERSEVEPEASGSAGKSEPEERIG
jgi:DNA-binding response OmpR family regulator